MANKTLQDFFGQSAGTDGEGVYFDVSEILTLVVGEPVYVNTEDFASEQIVTALIAYWFSTNYKDSITNNRLSQDKTVPFISNSGSARRNLVTRGEEIQVKHDFSFSVYTKDNSDFNPNDLVQAESQSEEIPPVREQGQL